MVTSDRPSAPVAGETTVESADDFADRQWSWLDREKLRSAVRGRDAAIRAEARAEALNDALDAYWTAEEPADAIRALPGFKERPRDD